MNDLVTAMFSTLGRAMFLLAAFSLCAPALAHEGHDDAGKAAMPAQALAPRLAAHSTDLELLAVWRGEKLVIFLDRYETNEPVTGATIELESGADRATATSAGEGLYQASAAWLAKPGTHPIVFTVQTKDLADLLQGTLEIPDDSAAQAALHAQEANAREHWLTRWAWVGAAALVVLLVLVVVATRRKQRGAKR
ncbi:MAG: hypothetical protein HY661_10235 [Betaproteobacteria bacterium]|nr:hypothetical protein [Betaproteobacteria bacterium]